MKLIILFLFALFLTGCDEINEFLAVEVPIREVAVEVSHSFSDDHLGQMQELSMLYANGDDYAHIDVMTIDMDMWEREHIYYGGHDELGRTLPALAFLSERNLGTSEDRSRQRHNPTGWNQEQIDGIWIHNRGHLIAYTLTFNFDDKGNFSEGYAGSEDNPVNLFTQTQHSNQRLMTRFEGAIRESMRNGCNVVFKASPVFRDEELMARGIWLQAVDDCDDVEFSVYIFNTQPGVNFNYLTGENY